MYLPQIKKVVEPYALQCLINNTVITYPPNILPQSLYLPNIETYLAHFIKLVDRIVFYTLLHMVLSPIEVPLQRSYYFPWIFVCISVCKHGSVMFCTYVCMSYRWIYVSFCLLSCTAWLPMNDWWLMFRFFPSPIKSSILKHNKFAQNRPSSMPSHMSLFKQCPIDRAGPGKLHRLLCMSSVFLTVWNHVSMTAQWAPYITITARVATGWKLKEYRYRQLKLTQQQSDSGSRSDIIPPLLKDIAAQPGTQVSFPSRFVLYFNSLEPKNRIIMATHQKSQWLPYLLAHAFFSKFLP